MIRSRPFLALLWATALVLAGACEPVPSIPSPAFSLPLDFSYACEGDDRTVAPSDDQTGASLDGSRMCADLTVAGSDGTLVTRQGHLFGVVMNQNPPGVSVVQLNPASGTRGVLDADRFTPGYSSIPVGDDPIRVLRASNWSSFFVVSAGSREVTRIVVQGVDNAVLFDRDSFDLPGVAGDAWLAKHPDGADRLYVTGAFEARLWIFNLGTDPSQPEDHPAPPLTEVALPALVGRLEPLGTGFVVTWKGRPVVSRLDADGALAAVEHGILPACADTLDNDLDGLVDHLDPDCYGASDPREEADGALPLPAATEPAISFAGTRSCEDLLDNDGDGLTDTDDPACTPSAPDGEIVPDCADGIDNDIDGQVDLADTGCYGGDDRWESGPGLLGPYFPSVVDAGAAGTFVYVLDQPRELVAVFQQLAGGSLARVNVPAHQATAPELAYVPYAGGEEASLPEVTAVAVPALVEKGFTDLPLPSFNALSLTAAHVLGELWTRSIPAAEGQTQAAVELGLSSSYWQPPACDPTKPDKCWQPPGDDQNYYVFAPRLDGAIQLFHAVIRGVPVHRWARHLPVEDRRLLVSDPLLSVRGTPVTLGAALKPGYPFMGPFKVEEELAASEEGVSPLLERQSGVWPPVDPAAADTSTWATDFDRVPTETWSVTYEGVIPGTSGRLGRLVLDGVFYAPGERFCEDGVEVGDTLVFGAAPEAMDAAYRLPLPVVTEEGVSCPVLPTLRAGLQVRVTQVGMDTLGVDPATVERVPVYPELDEAAIAVQGLSLSECLDALEVLEAADGFSPPTQPLTPAGLPARLEYQVRTRGVWRVQGSLSGFQHPWGWDFATGQCIKRSIDSRHAGRMTQATLKPGAAYQSCPPGVDQTAWEVLDDLVDTSATRFANWSFRMDMLPACEAQEDGTIGLKPTLRDTSWVFALTGVHNPAALLSRSTGLAPRLGRLDFRRDIVQIDTGTDAVTLVGFTPLGNTATFSPRFE